MEKKNYLKNIFIIIFVIIPVILIVSNMFFEPLGYILIINETNFKEINEILAIENYDFEIDNGIILINSKLDEIKILNYEFNIAEYQIDKYGEIAKYIKINGIDLYNVMTWISYIYILLIFGFIFWKKLFENSEFFRNYEDNDY